MGRTSALLTNIRLEWKTITKMDVPKLTGLNLGWVFNSRSACMCMILPLCRAAVWPNLELKTQPKQLEDSPVRCCAHLTNALAYYITKSITSTKTL